MAWFSRDIMMSDILNILHYHMETLFSFSEEHPLLFTQFHFWLFLAFVLAGFSFLHSRVLLRNTFLFFVSVFFYYKTSGIFTLILLFSTLSTFLIGKRVYACRQGSVGRKVWLVTGILTCLLVLCYFKYAYFITDMLNGLLGCSLVVTDYFALLGNAIMGSEVFNVEAILLPVGISFYTFQCISYLMDIQRGRIRPVANLLDYGFYVSFFPQLVAGPIVRAEDFTYQLSRPYFLSRRWFGIAVFWILNGMAKKIILSDYIAVNLIDRVFANPTMYSGYENLVALFGYSLQVYADFSGYTDIAIGVALLLGFHLPTNFNSPYKAVNAPQFWKRWHISLSRWLQNYLYIPMGGNRNATFATFAVITAISLVAIFLSGSVWVAIAIMAAASVTAIVALLSRSSRKAIVQNINALNTMLLGGLWHGASWNFVIWGGLNGLGMIIYRLWHPMAVWTKLLVVLGFTAVAYALVVYVPHPLWNIAFVWLGATAAGTFVRLLFCKFTATPVKRGWDILQTFVFITFTRLFFRAGSNLDPAEANEQAWNTATDMINQIGSPWNTQNIAEITQENWQVLVLIVLGMLIHWVGARTKRRYRQAFAAMPLWLMAIVVTLSVLVLYQFVTADLQKFIYFQF